MKDGDIQCTVISPPYNKKNIGGALVQKVKYENYNDNKNEEEYQKEQIKILNEIYRVSEVCFYNHKIRYDKGAIHPIEWITKTKWTLHQEIVWNRKITGNIRGWRCWNIDERIYWLVKKSPKELEQPLAQYTSIWSVPPENNNDHPAPFPIEIAGRCILLGSKEGETIYDAFMGSGTTAIASINTNRNWIGSEISKEYTDLANKRIEPYLNQTKLF